MESTYPLPFMTRQVFDALILIVIAIGIIAAFFRLRADFTRPLPPNPNDDTQPRKP
ncbi:MAG TPA: hypothetical protein PLQ56_19515 [Aggregatilineales bacterium]|nr:hypothetical protein [Aggregatilineales bacterium]